MYTITIFTETTISKGFAIKINKKHYIVTTSHSICTNKINELTTRSSYYENRKITINNEKVHLLYKSTKHDIALLSAPHNVIPLELHLLSYDNKDICQNYEYYIDNNFYNTYLTNIIVSKGDSGSPVLLDNKCIAILIGIINNQGCYLSSDVIQSVINEFKQFCKI